MVVNEQATTPLFHEGYVFGDQTNPRRRTFSTNYLEHWSTTTEYDCCVVTNEFDREGIQTSFIYDNLNRRTGSKRAGIETLDILDAAGNVVTNARVGTDESVMVLSISAYDLNGELVSQTVPGLGTTTFTNYDDGTYLVRKTINPDESYQWRSIMPTGSWPRSAGRRRCR